MHLKKYRLRSPGETSWLIIAFLLVFSLAFWLFEFSVPLFLLLLTLQLGYVLVMQRQFMGNALLVTQSQFADIYQIAEENSKMLNINQPKIFIEQNPFINAYAIGFKEPYSIVLTSALVESFTRDELDFVIGHEMGHIKFKHSRTLSLISPLGNDIPILTILYGPWQRKAEYTADRVGLLLAEKIRPAIKAMIKMSVGDKLSKVVNFDEIVKQIEKGRKGIISGIGEFLLTHPYLTNRIQSLAEYNHGDYSHALNINIEEKKKIFESKTLGSLIQSLLWGAAIIIVILVIGYLLEGS